MFNDISSNYDFLNHFLSLGIDIYWRKIFVRKLNISNGDHIADIACGTGDVCFEILKRHSAIITGIDLAENMIEGHYSFLGPIYDDYTLAKLFTIADLFIMPGYIGLAIVHAFSFGLPVLTTNVQIHSPEIQYLHQGYNGYMVDDGDIEALAHEMKNLLTDREKLNELSNNAVRTVNEYADVNFMVSQMAYALRLDRKS